MSSVYEIVRTRQVPYSILRNIWHQDIPLKVSIFMWCLLNGFLPFVKCCSLLVSHWHPSVYFAAMKIIFIMVFLVARMLVFYGAIILEFFIFFPSRQIFGMCLRFASVRLGPILLPLCSSHQLFVGHFGKFRNKLLFESACLPECKLLSQSQELFYELTFTRPLQVSQVFFTQFSFLCVTCRLSVPKVVQWFLPSTYKLILMVQL